MFPAGFNLGRWTSGLQAWHAPDMHAWLAHAYHLAQFGLHVLLHPMWRAPGAALLVAGIGRLLGLAKGPFGAALVVCAAVLAGWLLLDPHFVAWPPPPVARLPGLALVLLAAAAWRAGGRARWLALPICAAVAAWWLRGAPLGGNAILNCMPVFLGLAAALPLARRLVRGDRGWGGVAAALSLAGALLLAAGAAVHWIRAAMVVAVAALALLGVEAAAATLAGAVVMVAAACMVASDRGRLIPVDAACLAPLLAWLILPRLAKRPATRTAKPPAKRPAKRQGKPKGVRRAREPGKSAAKT